MRLLDSDLLVSLNVLVYASLAAGVVVFKRSTYSLRGCESFKGLGDLLKASFPDLPAGFTLREGLARARTALPGLDWSEIENELRAYERYRYGGSPDAGVPGPALSELAAALRRSRG